MKECFLATTTISNEDFAMVMGGLDQAADIAAGKADPATYRLHVPKTIDVKAIRQRAGLSQPAFAARYGFSVGAVRDWEQGRRRPEASARVLLTVIEKNPKAVEEALAGN